MDRLKPQESPSHQRKNSLARVKVASLANSGSPNRDGPLRRVHHTKEASRAPRLPAPGSLNPRDLNQVLQSHSFSPLASKLPPVGPPETLEVKTTLIQRVRITTHLPQNRETEFGPWVRSHGLAGNSFLYRYYLLP